MGIRNLKVHLSPFADQVTFGYSTAATKNKCEDPHQYDRIVIDGPALAYHIYYKLLTCRPAPLHASLAAQPSYEEIGIATLAYLDKVETCGIVLDGILFDGYLPPKKKNVRIQRLETCLGQIIAYNSIKRIALTPSEITLLEKPLDISASILFHHLSLPSRNPKALPAVPFLVPAVLDTLGTSRFAKMTHVVEGEADPFCALAARQRGCSVLTSDSDLLVHDLGTDGAVMFFNELDLQEVAGTEYLSARIFRPQRIALRLNIVNLSRLGYELAEHSPIPFGEALRKARQPLRSEELGTFRDFSLEYMAPDPPSEPKALRMATSNTNPTFLDPRISELVVQSLVIGEESLDVYLPVLIDDPSRLSAWAPSAELRCLAYSLLLGPGTCIHEYARKGFRIVPEKVETWNQQKLLQFVRKLSDGFKRAATTFTEMPGALAWRLICIARVLTWHMNSARMLPPACAVEKVLGGGASDGLTLERDLLLVQIESQCYSLRMLQQILHLSILQVPDDAICSVKQLSADMSNLPQLRQLLSSPRKGAGKQDTRRQIDLILLLMAEDHSIQEREYLRQWATFERKKKRTQKERAKRVHQNRKSQMKIPNNKYDLLAEGP